MKYSEYFGKAKVLVFDDEFVSVNARQSFYVDNPGKSLINIVGFGFFELYVNGKRVSEDLFLPLNTEFHERSIVINDKPLEEKFGHRTYVSVYDITDYIVRGKNVIAVMLGNGWYSDKRQLNFGHKKLFFKVSVIDGGYEKQFVSDETLRFSQGFVKSYCLTRGEEQDFRDYNDDWMSPDYDESLMMMPKIGELPDTDYFTTDCPPDRVVESIEPVLMLDNGYIKYYDTGINTSGRVVLKLMGNCGEKITILHSEEKHDDNTINTDCCCFDQISSFVCDGKERIAFVRFTWNAFRYFSVEGNAQVLRFERVHTDCKVSSEFNSENKVLNWIYSAFINTQLSNMHSGIPSDCPHIERRGYTGDGQLACNAGMTVLDSKSFYRKWLYDISDCQDKLTGHVQYTAPYTHSGGGPGGWGCAIVHVPFMYFKHYGDISPMKEMLSGMLEYFRFLDNHSDNNLVVSDMPGQWCLGDWCTAHDIAIPEPFVNNYFYIRSIDEIVSLKNELNLDDAIINKLTSKRLDLVNAVYNTYYDKSTGDFCKQIQGANAFALDIGLGDDRTYEHLVEYYRNEKMYDTGIFGTDILTRVLFERGNGDIAYDLLSSQKEFSFGNIMNQDSTTLWEYWYGKRSHSHPMFGAVTAYLFEFLLGIKYFSGKCIVSPVYPGRNETFSGKMVTETGEISISISYRDNLAKFDIKSDFDFVFSFGNTTSNVTSGKSCFEITM